MSTRRPKVPPARTAGGSPAAGGGPSAGSGAQPARRKTVAAPSADTITATKAIGGPTAAGKLPAEKSAATKARAKPAATKARAKPAATKAKRPTASTAGNGAAEPRTSGFRRAPRKPAVGTDTGMIQPDPTDDLRPVPAKTFSGRLLVLAMVTAAITVLLAPSVSTYLHQRSEIAALEAEIAAQEHSGQELQSELDRWADPNYIKQQARERIFLVMPGETRYLVKGEQGVENAEQQAQDDAVDLHWVDALWTSVTRSAAAQ